MHYSSLLLLLLCQGTQGKLRESSNRRVQVETSPCEDGTDCTSDACKAIAEGEASKEVCDSVSLAMPWVANPQRKMSAVPMTSPFCVQFNNQKNTEGFNGCPTIGEVVINNFGADDPINPLSMDNFLHLTDLPGGSYACGTGNEYTGDWTSLANETACNELCFDVKLFNDGCHPTMPGCTLNASNNGYYRAIYPTILLHGGAPYAPNLNAVFKAYNFMTDNDGSSPEWRRICAPLAPLTSTGHLPSNEYGYWFMMDCYDYLGEEDPQVPEPLPCDADFAWSILLTNIEAIVLPLDFSDNPLERIGYDNICIVEVDCTHHCDPKPLSYWQYEWSCAAANQEVWYSTFTALFSNMETFPDNGNICQILSSNCSGHCGLAEQEFTALLLNIASGKLSLDCCVKECDNCVHNTASIMQLVDTLLALSSRSDYDCSRALQFLTGINQGEIFCDSCSCTQTDECTRNNGSCVPKESCTPSATVGCTDFLCGPRDGTSECTCKTAYPTTGSPTPVKPSTAKPTTPVTKEPTTNPSTAKPTTNPVTKTPTTKPTTVKPTSKPVTKIPTTKPTTVKPTSKPVMKIPTTKPTTVKPTSKPVMMPSLPVTDKPTPGDATPSPDGCIPIDRECELANGQCVEECLPTDVTKCVEDLCKPTDGTKDDGTKNTCYCKIGGCDDPDPNCRRRNGICVGLNDCDPETQKCVVEFCGEQCACRLKVSIHVVLFILKTSSLHEI
eukprot:CCRYP_019063-RA/>CCRYP_019063-RA protein AED:0.32 eAED:0.06 QI:0/-1/0/1/-1/1/1/0/725